MNGAEYAWSVLQRNNLQLESLLEAAHNQETVWLEFKADPFCHRDKGESSSGEILWHTLKAVVAMVNTRGGCVVFGVDDKTLDPVSLNYKDESPVDDFDRFHRQLEEGILSKVHFTISPAKDDGITREMSLSSSVLKYCSCRSGVTYRGRPVSVLLVTPSPDKEYVHVTERTKDRNGRETKVDQKRFVRRRGDLGKTEYMSVASSDGDQWERPRLDFDDWFIEKQFNNMLSPIPGFVGRESFLLKLEELLNVFGKWRIPLLYGVPGIGKSQVAFMYARRHAASYDSLVYIDASQSESFVDAVASVARNPDFRRCFLPGTDSREQMGQDAQALFMSVKIAIARGVLGRVLMVVDNVCHPNVFRPALLHRFLGEKVDLDKLHIIFISRCPRLRFKPDDIVAPIEVKPLGDNEALKILQNKLLAHGPGELNAAMGLVKYLGGNPWALDLVGEYLSQKTCREEHEYQNCLKLLQEEVKGAFPPRDRNTELVGNATGVIGIRELLEPTIRELLPEELDICRLLTANREIAAWEEPLMAAYAHLVGGSVDSVEWNWLRESLKAKLILSETQNEYGQSELGCCDRLLAKGLSDLSDSPRIADAYLEYLRLRCRYGSDNPNRDALSRWEYMRDCCPDRSRVVSALFDEDRRGWPLGLLGIDNLTSVLHARTGFTWDHVLEICRLAEGACRYAADVQEIRSLADDDVSEDERWKKYGQPILQKRLRIYANEPRMIGRSYLHAAQQIQGSSVPYEEVESLLKRALEFLPPGDEACRFPRYDALDHLAYCADRECEDIAFREGADTPRVRALRAVVRDTMNEAFALDPVSCLDRFQGDEELFRECADEGVYYR